MRLLPGWRNGRRGGLKSRCPSGRAGSNPAPGIQESKGVSVARVISQNSEPRRARKNPAGLGLTSGLQNRKKAASDVSSILGLQRLHHRSRYWLSRLHPSSVLLAQRLLAQRLLVQRLHHRSRLQLP